jgi:hypothetical protein
MWLSTGVLDPFSRLQLGFPSAGKFSILGGNVWSFWLQSRDGI